MMVINSSDVAYVSLYSFFKLNQNIYIDCDLSGCALDYHKAIDSFVHLHSDLWPYLLSEKDWHSIDLVTTWLKSFRTATTQMSATQTPMLSSIHAIFCGLEEDLQDIIRSLPNSTSPCLMKGLTDAHHKLSDYYQTFDKSPFYIWSSCTSNFIFNSKIIMGFSPFSLFAVLDPCISYKAMKDEFKNDSDLATHLEMAKADLQEYFKVNYPSLQPSVESYCQSLSATTSLSSITSSSSSGSPQKNFTARFQHKHTPTDELTKFWNLPQEDFDTCDPLQWWHSHHAQFPQLYRLVHDIFSIPGNYL